MGSAFAALTDDAAHAGATPATLLTLPYVSSAGTVVRIWATFAGFVYVDTLVDMELVTGVVQVTADAGAPIGTSASQSPSTTLGRNISLALLINLRLPAGAHVFNLDWWSFSDTISGAGSPNHGIIESPAASFPDIWHASLYLQEMAP